MTQSPKMNGITDGGGGDDDDDLSYNTNLTSNSIISSAGITVDDFLSLEESYLRVPFEQSKRSFRNLQRVMDREFGPIATFITGTNTTTATSNTTYSNSITNPKIPKRAPVDLSDPDKRERLVKRLLDVKSKLLQEETEERENRVTKRWEACLELLNGEEEVNNEDDLIAEETKHSAEEILSEWKENKLLRLICDHLLRDGKREAVEEILSANPKLKPHLDLDVYEEAETIIQDLLSKQPSSCLQFSSECRTALLQLEKEQDSKNKSQLEFIVKRQEFVEYVRRGDINGAIAYARKTWSPPSSSTAPSTSKDVHSGPASNAKVSDQIPREIQQCLALLVMPLDVKTTQYKFLLDSAERWADCAALFSEKLREMVGLPNSCSQLESLAMCGLSTLKTYSCLRSLGDDSGNDSKGKTKAINSCPVCLYPSLSGPLAHAHHETSMLICPYTRKLMDANNPPMVLPNGQVYSEEALSKLVVRNKPEIVIKCPKSGEEYQITQIRKCFIS